MGIIKKKPYEISIWEDSLVTENNIEYYKEVKLAIIGSDRMESPNRAFDPVLIENVNGEKTLTFSIAYKYFDELKGEIVINPFYKYLINERKVKLYYNDEWFEFLIKECNESSSDYIFKYTAQELFSLELSKLGYDVELNTSLNNNQGTIVELANKVLENTDWQVDEDACDLMVQRVQEPIYEATLLKDIEVLNLDTNQTVTLSASQHEPIYIFYSYINNRISSFVQFISEADRSTFEYDDDNVITSTNYRILEDVEYEIVNDEVTGIKNIATINSLYLSNQAYRLVYKIRTVYDPVMDRTVELYKAEYNDSTQEIYHFLDYNYTTSDIVTSYITNGTDFQALDEGIPHGWSNNTWTSTKKVLQPLNLTTYPEISSGSKLALLKDMSEINGYLELKFNGVRGQANENTYFNRGFEDNASLIDHISAGEKFVLRTRYSTANTKHGNLTAGKPTAANSGLRVVVAKYETVDIDYYLKANDTSSIAKMSARKILPNEIVLDFNGGFTVSKNIVNNGTFNTNHTQYLVDGVIQVPSTAYVYQTSENSTEYIWFAKIQRYIERNLSQSQFTTLYPNYTWSDYQSFNAAFADYYYTTATARRSFSKETLQNPSFNLGVFLYTNDLNLVSKYIYLQDIQLTRYYKTTVNGVESPVIMGNIPTAISNEVDHFYLKPKEGATEEEITTYDSIEFLASEFGLKKNLIKPVYNEQSEKILSIEASNSNYFNILQDLCETFECWLDIRVQHEDDGSISLDSNKNPIKKIAFKEYAGKDNFAGFKKGINLNNIERQIDSNEIVTKLIVDPVQSEYSDDGLISIQNAKSNPSGQSHIINFSYYLNRGLITNVSACNKDLLNYYADLKKYNNDITKLQQEFILLINSINKITANRNVYSAAMAEAQDNYNDAIQRFYEITKLSYEKFVTKYANLEDWAKKAGEEAKNYLENESVLDVVGTIYTSTITKNNYSGLLTNLDKEYHELDLKCYGAKEYAISVTSIPAVVGEETTNPSTQVTIDNYTSGIEFVLIDSNGNKVTFRSSPNDRIFNVSSALQYEYIIFTQIPANYKLRYFDGNTAKELSRSAVKNNKFKIYDSVKQESLNKRFIIVPDATYAKKYIGYEKTIDNLIKEKKQREQQFYQKYSRFLQEGTWSSQDYIDSELYYLDALQVSDTSSQPKVSYTIEVLEISQLENFQNYDFRVGDKTYIEDEDFFGNLIQGLPQPNGSVLYVKSPVREEVIVSEVEWHLDEPDNNTITVQNYKTRFEDLFQRISATVQTVQRNEITYPKTSTILDQSGLINGTLLANSLNGIGGVGFALTTNGSVSATDDGLLIRNLLYPSNVMKLASTGLQVSTDSGKTWKTAISAAGISTDVLTAGTINTQKIWLMDGKNPSFRWDKSGLNAYGLDKDGNETYNLKTYVRFDKYGLYGIKDGEDYVAKSLDDVRNKAFFGVTWDGFFIKNSYADDSEVSITSDDDIVVKKNNIKRIHIGAVEKDDTGAPVEYGIKIRNDRDEVVFETGDDGNIAISGTINARAGNFDGIVTIGKDEINSSKPYIVIDGESENPIICSSNYADGAGTGWIIDSNGDATFSNVSVRGAIKTAVFEYEEIQAVGGAFLFRPSSTIKSARYEATPTEEIDENGETYTVDYYHYEEGIKIYNDLIVTVEKPLMFRKDNWVKLSNYNELGENPAEDVSTHGLVHIYKVSNTDFQELPGETIEIIGEDGEVIEITTEPIEPTYELTLEGGCAILDSIDIENIEGGALIDFGSHATHSGVDVPGEHNYGIGINSSDNYVNLPARAISLFETTIHPNNTLKVTYNYRGILGTLPRLPMNEVDNSIYNKQMAGTQGIYTDNMYLGDANQFIAFYEDENGKKQLKIKANQIVFEVVDPDTHEPTGDWHDVNQIEAEGTPGPAGEDAINVVIESNIGNYILKTDVTITLTCTVYSGSKDITNQVTTFTWTKKNQDGNIDANWIPTLASVDGRSILVDASDIQAKAIFVCTVEF